MLISLSYIKEKFPLHFPLTERFRWTFWFA